MTNDRRDILCKELSHIDAVSENGERLVDGSRFSHPRLVVARQLLPKICTVSCQQGSWPINLNGQTRDGTNPIVFGAC